MTHEPRFTSFEQVEQILEKFHLQRFNDMEAAQEYASYFNIERLVRQIPDDSTPSQRSEVLRTVSEFEPKPLAFDLPDLCRLHWLILSRKVISVLEFGSGFSTVVMADALQLLSEFFSDWALQSLRCKQPFHVHSVEEDQRFMDTTKRRFPATLARFATLSRSSVTLEEVDHRPATFYSTIPNVCPDLIYLDGPSQFATTERLRGLSLADPERMPMAADLISLEFLLQPGTLIVVDGRTANARFLRAYLRRDWAYHHDTRGDIHIFELQESPLGALNAKQLEFCLRGRWLLDEQ